MRFNWKRCVAPTVGNRGVPLVLRLTGVYLIRCEPVMRHGWIIDVLTDLKTYSKTHGMVALAQKVDEALRVARAEIAAQGPDNGDNGPPKHGRN